MTDDDPPSREKKQRTDEYEKEERQKVVSSPLWELIVNNDDISCFHILPKLNGIIFHADSCTGIPVCTNE